MDKILKKQAIKNLLHYYMVLNKTFIYVNAYTLQSIYILSFLLLKPCNNVKDKENRQLGVKKPCKNHVISQKNHVINVDRAINCLKSYRIDAK